MLKEISDYIATHGDKYTDLQTLVGDKVTKVKVKDCHQMILLMP